MSEMIERIAKIISPNAFEATETGWLWPWAEQSQDKAREKAARILEAIRKPTAAMENAGYTDTAFAKGTWPGSLNYRPDYIYQAMIDEALK